MGNLATQEMKAVETERPCPVCGGRSYAPFADEKINPQSMNDFTYASRKEPEFMCLRLVRCATCDLVYAPTPPASSFLSDAYKDASFDSAAEAEAAARTYARVLAPHVARLAHRNAAVDVGAGSGPLLPWLKQQGFDPVIGIEPSRAAIEAARPAVRGMLHEGMFAPEMLAGIKSSLFCSFMTFEHMDDPMTFTQAAFQLLEPGGMLAVVVHNWQAALNRLLGLRSPIIDVEHLQLFNPRAIRTMLERVGFESVAVKAIGNAYPLRYWLRLTPFPANIKRMLFVATNCMGLSDLPISLRVGNMLAVGIKPSAERQ